MNKNSDILISKATRFSPNKANSPYVSYIDPERQSDFSPKRSRGPVLGTSTKFDFTRQFKGNPGVG